ncbi:hypothetical protein M440DRAFT_1257932 [Trichoderma longibrachiatum ATCC 18648]|uniref:Uncharacterized protein n=1 Tax=Trichoderma longibrachiatum ATCC 18648 TaxID=983965 RepID=A0A2T4C280_TRILO|nr:hypothetical protein M440DRAFT_1257932 [Trichoderma longibrachiatum ATCC 18648]
MAAILPVCFGASHSFLACCFSCIFRFPLTFHSYKPPASRWNRQPTRGLRLVRSCKAPLSLLMLTGSPGTCAFTLFLTPYLSTYMTCDLR